MTDEELKARVFAALQRNVNYQAENVFGVPASQLDEKVFYKDASFLKDAPFLSTLMENPNHIGCHTLDRSEPFFEGIQEIERELIEICARDILKGRDGGHDGYVASGGTEANIQAIWVYRNQFRQDHRATKEEIAILCSSDSHYSLRATRASRCRARLSVSVSILLRSCLRAAVASSRASRRLTSG